MDQRTIPMLFALLRSAICGTKLTREERSRYAPELLPDLVNVSSKHDVDHLLVLGLKKNGLVTKENAEIESHIFKAVYRYGQISGEYERLCEALENARIPFLPLKGSVLREYYPEAWMRTSCDIDILVHREDLHSAVAFLTEKHHFTEKERGTHDVSLFSPSGVHVELHFDLVEEGRAGRAINVLRSVWENATLRENHAYLYEMTDPYFYFYHIAHMAKHFENGGCGIRPFVDLWILDKSVKADRAAREELLRDGDLLRFAEVSRSLCEVWFGNKEPDDFLLQVQDFLLHGGVYGSAENRVAIQQRKKGGRIGYLLSRVFVPYEKLARYYPVLEKHRWLMPVMQIRRWFMLLRPEVGRMAKKEIALNKTIDAAQADHMAEFQKKLGL